MITLILLKKMLRYAGADLHLIRLCVHVRGVGILVYLNYEILDGEKWEAWPASLNRSNMCKWYKLLVWLSGSLCYLACLPV